MKKILLPATACLLAACAHGGYMRPPVAAETLSEPSPQDDRGMYLELIRRMQREGAYYASLAHIDAYRKRFPDTPVLRSLQAEALRRTGRGDEAAEIYRGLLKGPEAAAAWHGLGLIAATQERSGDAEFALAKAVELDPLNVDYLGDLGFNRLRNGQAEEARAPLAQAAELAPGDPRAAANLALWMLLHGQASQAEAIMRQATLPDATRNEVYRLAGNLRNARPRPAPGAAPGVASTPPSSVPATAAPPRPGIVAPPSMLERFGSPNSPSSETTP
ncbi:tetratricopeptide repeat protein [[Pseudomonas] boreopolis]|uniref:Lipoprotein n=1 Tax=Xanthomonas boreopolis TaxID=86183 RepID=A0A919KJI7_9XANT|nr:lipoprotein [[Pseudomonas] boreopolis]